MSPEAGTYFEMSEDGNTIVGADGTEYVTSEEKSKDCLLYTSRCV